MRISIASILRLATLALIASGCDGGSKVGVAFVAPSWLKGVEVRDIPTDSLEHCSTLGLASARIESDKLSRVVDARILSDGRIAAADRQARSIMIFSGSDLKAVIGRLGKGPGEFTSLDGMAVSADTLLAWDSSNRRVTAFRSTGELLWTEKLTATYPGRWGGEFDGRINGDQFPFMAHGFRSAALEGEYRDTTTVLEVRSGDAAAAMGVRVPSEFLFMVAEPPGWRTMREIFSPAAYLAVAGGAAWVGESSSGVLARLAESGLPETAVRLDVRRSTVSPAAIEVERQAIRSSGSGVTAPAFAELATRIRAFDTLPVVDRLQGTSEGYVWISEYAAGKASSRRHWVIDTMGRYVGCVATTPKLRIMDSRNGRMLIMAWDAFDVPSLELHVIPADWPKSVLTGR